MKSDKMKKPANAKRKYTTITIPSPLFEKISEVIKDTGFSSVSDYVTYVLRETIASIEQEKQGKTKANDALTKKLRALGYI